MSRPIARCATGCAGATPLSATTTARPSIIADNYFGYCKKEVKTQISLSANLFGGAEEEHSGGALVFPSWDEGQEFTAEIRAGVPSVGEVVGADPGHWTLDPAGWAASTLHSRLILVPQGATFSLKDRAITWAGTEG